MACSQALFCTGYIYFLVVNIHVILSELFKTEGDETVTAIVCFIIFTLLCWVRRIEVFAATHVFGNVMILITIIYVFIEAGLDIKNHNGFKLGGGIAPISARWGQAIGLSVYSYEGIGVVLPIMEVTKD